MDEPFPEKSFLKKEWIAHGSFGQVYLIRDGARKAVVKYIEVLGDQLKTFEAECNVLKSLDQKNIVKYLGIHETSEDFGAQIMGIIMEHCDGGTLREAISNPKLVYSMFWVLCWAGQMFDALKYIHSKSILHRDIKPTNILLRGFDLMLSDFGSTRTLTGTCSTAHVTTLRYMSPPQIFDSATGERTTRQQSSFKNDVYSMGLVFWEIVERRICFSQYGRLDFAYQAFMTDYLARQLTEIELPKCPVEFQEIIQSCTNFDYSLRSEPEAIRAKVRATMQGYWTDGGVIEAPEYVENQTELLRPIGFDGKESRVEVIDLDLREASPTPDAFFPDDAGEGVQDDVDPFIHENIKKSLWREKFVKAFKKLTSAERDVVQSQISEIIESTERSVTFHDYHQNPCAQTGDPPDDPSDLVSFLASIRWHILIDLHVARAQFIEWYRMMRQCCAKDSNNFACRIEYYGLQMLIQSSKDLRRRSYIKRVAFACYFLEQAKEEWFLWEESEEIGNEYLRLVSKSFTDFRVCKGKWIDKGKYIVTNTQKSEKGSSITDGREKLEDFEALHYSHNELVETSVIIGVMEREKMKQIRLNKLRSQFFVPLGETRETSIKLPKMKTEFPVPGYIFQLRNPPRNPCNCELRCGTKGIPKGYPDVEMQILCYVCSKDKVEGYLRGFVELCDALNYGETGRDGLLTLKPFEEEIHWRSFVFVQLLPEQEQQGDAKPIVLLDLPDNYKDNERIPCFDHDWNFFTLDVQVVREALERTVLDQRSFVYIQGPFDL